LSSIFNKLNKIMTIYIYIVVISNPATIYCNVHIRILSNLAKKSVIIFELPILKNYCTRRQLVFRVQRRGIFFWTQMKVDPPAIAMLRHERAGYRDFEYRENTYPLVPGCLALRTRMAGKSAKTGHRPAGGPVSPFNGFHG
jgi:hypothetical protein